jgi:hypothetical protein
MCIEVIKYIKMPPKSDQMFQKTFLSGIDVNSIAQSRWSWLENNLIGLKHGNV